MLQLGAFIGPTLLVITFLSPAFRVTTVEFLKIPLSQRHRAAMLPASGANSRRKTVSNASTLLPAGGHAESRGPTGASTRRLKSSSLTGR